MQIRYNSFVSEVIELIFAFRRHDSDDDVDDKGEGTDYAKTHDRWELPFKGNKLTISIEVSENTYESRHKKTCLQVLRPGKTQTSLLSYRS